MTTSIYEVIAFRIATILNTILYVLCSTNSFWNSIIIQCDTLINEHSWNILASQMPPSLHTFTILNQITRYRSSLIQFHTTKPVFSAIKANYCYLHLHVSDTFKSVLLCSYNTDTGFQQRTACASPLERFTEVHEYYCYCYFTLVTPSPIIPLNTRESKLTATYNTASILRVLSGPAINTNYSLPF